ncbi:isoprenylcysteine carboxylmethyltransferase family protein [Actinoplanes hulinensis]|uniref:Isoprenylcysteine carboxylmethyltransferase family protein n=1 Tax=Actinoplanes hulinensis TaxID=1144547 RepID=A0ABS7BEQ2_9ACTN|nr:isoprenylcysteine carboxylmethyltransferase family protein [Actinoplanes hulinensis]
MTVTAARYLCLLIPVLALLAAARDRQARAGASLAFIAAATGLAVLHEIATAAGWHGFANVDGTYRGFPVDLWLGWAILWGPVPVLLRRWLPLPVALGLLFWLDVIAMPRLTPLIDLGPHWLLGETLGLIAVALPAQLLGRWTADRRHLIPRVLLQFATFAVLLLWLTPTVAFTLGDGSWSRSLDLPTSAIILLGQVALAVALPALAGVREFALRGGGTPYPWDPPARLVTTGVYAYLANPMQVSAILLQLLLAAATRSATLAAVALSTTAFAAAIAGPHERQDLQSRYGQSWRDYRDRVRDWRPRRTPYEPVPARLWLDDDCGPCTTVRDALQRRHPAGLTILPASTHPGTLWRARYEAADGHTADGVAAVARSLEHIGALPAYISMFLLLPGLNRLAQLITDALIAPPHPAGGAPLRQNDRAEATGEA